MDWHPIMTSAPWQDGRRPPAGAGAPPRQVTPGRTRADRLDLAVADLVEQQAEILLAGIQLAAQRAEPPPATGPGGTAQPPCWPAGEVELLVRLVRLALAAGVVLPHGVTAAPPADLATPGGHLIGSRACYRRAVEVLDRVSTADEVPAPCREDAIALRRRYEARERQLDSGHPAARWQHGLASVTDRHGEFLPGALLG